MPELINVFSRVTLYFGCGHHRLTDGVYNFFNVHALVGETRLCLECNKYQTVESVIPTEMPGLVECPKP